MRAFRPPPPAAATDFSDVLAVRSRAHVNESRTLSDQDRCRHLGPTG
jgi:hypothetical protein